MKDISSMRTDYKNIDLNEKDIGNNPIDFFKEWFDDAVEKKVQEPNAMVLATTCKNNFPSTRVVLLKGLENEEFVFFTNYLSKKAKQIEENPFVSLNFFWKEFYRQVSIEGKIKKIEEEKSQEYFQTRPKESQISACVSKQSFPLKSRDFLNQRFLEAKKFFENKEVPCPDNWGGYSVEPILIEFWQGKENRLHDRILFKKNSDSKWEKERLYP